MDLGELDFVIDGKFLQGQKNVGTRGEAEDELPSPLALHDMIFIRRHCISFPCFGHVQILLICLPFDGWLKSHAPHFLHASNKYDSRRSQGASPALTA
jgi:hypothetical protein